MISPQKAYKEFSYDCPYINHSSEIIEVCLKRLCDQCRFSCKECLQKRHQLHERDHIKIEDIKKEEQYYLFHDFSEYPDIEEFLEEKFSLNQFIKQITQMFDHFTQEINKNLHTLKKDIIIKYSTIFKDKEQQQNLLLDNLQTHFSTKLLNSIITQLKPDFSNYNQIQTKLNEYVEKKNDYEVENKFQEYQINCKNWVVQKRKIANFKSDLEGFLEHYNKELIQKGQNINMDRYSNINKFYKTFQSQNNVKIKRNQIIFPKENTGWAQIYSDKFSIDLKFHVKIKIKCPFQQINKQGQIFFKLGLISYNDPQREGLNVQNTRTGNWIVLDSTNLVSKHPFILKDGKQWGKSAFRQEEETEWTIKGQVSNNEFIIYDSNDICYLENSFNFQKQYKEWILAISCFSAGSQEDFVMTIQ